MSIILPNPPLAIDAGPGDTPEYPAAAFRSAVSALLAKTPGSAGVARTGALDPRSFAISVSGGNVHAAAGGYVIGSSAGAYLCALDDQAQIGSLAPADPTNDRRDSIVLRIDDPDNGGRSDRAGSIEIVTGTPSPIPQAPVPDGTSVYDQLATISVPSAGSGQPAVTDTRTHTGAAGGVITVGRVQDLSSVSQQAGTLAYVTVEGRMYIRLANRWEPLVARDELDTVARKTQAGSVMVSPRANTPTSKWVAFSPAFTKPPVVTATADSSVPGTTVSGVGVHGVTRAGFNVAVTRSSTTNTGVFWIAVGT